MTNRSGRRVASILTGVTVATVLVVAIVIALYRTGSLNDSLCEGECPPEYVSSPLRSPGPSPTGDKDILPPPVSGLDPQAVSKAVTGALDTALLGKGVSIAVWDVAADAEVWSRADTARIPASSLKMVTGYAALSALDPEQRFSTSFVETGEGQYVLVGGGDPMLGIDSGPGSSLKALAERAAAELAKRGVDEISFGFDDTLFSGPTLSPSWKDGYLTGGASSHVTALRTRPESRQRDVDHPVRDAASAFARLLERAGVEVRGEPGPVAVAGESSVVASVRSPTVSDLVSRLVRTSSNYISEVLARHIAIARDKPASFTGGSEAITDVLAASPIETDGLVLFDGSGLSRSNRVAPTTLAQLLSTASKDPRYEALFDGLPIAGLDGTLDRRFVSPRTAHGRGYVRAKTGTLNGVNSLTGIAVTADGGAAAFSVLADQVPQGGGWLAEVALDRIASALAGCACR